MMMITFPNIDPVIMHVYGPLVIRWYSVAYVAGILLGICYFNFNARRYNKDFITLEVGDKVLPWIVFSVIIGGRMGYVLFYNAGYYAAHLTEIFAVWNGGMSFHGGLVGCIIGCWLFCRKYKLLFLKFTDLVVVSAPIGLFFGRVANFINAELYGRVTDMPWGVVFPGAGALPRHPSQIYEAILEGIIIFITLSVSIRYLINKSGALSGLFLVLYSLFRSILEIFREPDSHIGFIYNLTMGQLLSLPMFVIGMYLILLNKKQ